MRLWFHHSRHMGLVEGSTLASTPHLTMEVLLISASKAKFRGAPSLPSSPSCKIVPGFSVQSLSTPPGLIALRPSGLLALLGIAAHPAFSPTQTLWPLVTSCNAPWSQWLSLGPCLCFSWWLRVAWSLLDQLCCEPSGSWDGLSLYLGDSRSSTLSYVCCVMVERTEVGHHRHRCRCS